VQVKTIKPVEFLYHIIPKDVELTVKPFHSMGTDFLLVREGNFKGYVIQAKNCEVIHPHKTYSEKEWNDMENHYMSLLDKEIAAKDRAVDMVASLGKQMVKKNEEIEKLEFYVSALSIGLSASSEAIKVLRNSEPYKQNG
jgi:hypothetical protein